MSSKRKEVYWSVDDSPSGSLAPLTGDIRATKPQLHATRTQAKKKTSRRSTLKTLCPEDKHKVRRLIEDLAKTGAEKDAIEQLLKKERSDFDEKLSQLHLEQQNLQEERTRLERSLHDSELQLQAIKSQNDKVVQAQSIPALHSSSIGEGSRDHIAPPTTAINLDHSLNYLLQSANKVQLPECASSSTSSSSLISSLHTTDLAPSQQHHPPLSIADDSITQSPHTEPYPSAGFSDAVKLTHTAVQTDHCNINIPVVSSASSQHSMLTTMTSSEFDHKMENMMATALLNAKDTVNTIEAISQSLLMKSVSRESSLMALQHPMISTQPYMANNQAVANSQEVFNTPRMTTIQEPTSSQYSQENNRTAVTSTHTDHMIPSSQQNYTLYDSTHYDDTTIYLNRDDNELQLEDLAETLNSSTLPMGWLDNHYLSNSTSCGRKNSNIAMATQPVGEYLIINHSDSDIINDLFFLQ